MVGWFGLLNVDVPLFKYSTEIHINIQIFYRNTYHIRMKTSIWVFHLTPNGRFVQRYLGILGWSFIVYF